MVRRIVATPFLSRLLLVVLDWYSPLYFSIVFLLLPIVGPLPGEDGWEREGTTQNEGGLLQRSFIFSRLLFPLTQSIFSYRYRILFAVERDRGAILVLSVWSYVMRPASQSELGKHNMLAMEAIALENCIPWSFTQ
jgi:hypothetical protein